MEKKMEKIQEEIGIAAKEISKRSKSGSERDLAELLAYVHVLRGEYASLVSCLGAQASRRLERKADIIYFKRLKQRFAYA